MGMTDTTASDAHDLANNPAADPTGESVPQLGKRAAALVKSGDKLASEADERCAKAYSAANDKYVSTGQCLKQLQKKKPRDVTWADFVKEHCGLSKQRASEIIRIADGKTTLAALRAKSRSSSAKHRQKVRHGDGRGRSEPSDRRAQNQLPKPNGQRSPDQLSGSEYANEPDFRLALSRCADDVIHLGTRSRDMLAAARDSADREDIQACLEHIRSVAEGMIQALSAPPEDKLERRSSALCNGQKIGDHRCLMILSRTLSTTSRRSRRSASLSRLPMRATASPLSCGATRTMSRRSRNRGPINDETPWQKSKSPIDY